MTQSVTTSPAHKHQPAELVQISPEALEIATTYLKTLSIANTAAQLHLPEEIVSQFLGKREVKAYVDAVFLDLGYRNRFKLAEALDAIIEKKLADLEEATVGSQKDIADLLALAHKMRMDEIAAQTKLLEAQNKQDHIARQVNVQINNDPSGNYGTLLEMIVNGKR